MKCPHCGSGIHENPEAVNPVFQYPPRAKTGGGEQGHSWILFHQQCPECFEAIISLKRTAPQHKILRFRAYPSAVTRVIPAEVVDPYRQDFTEACKALNDSPKASAALSRRCLQAVLKDKAGTKAKDIYDQIEEVIIADKVPSHIQEGLHAVRSIGNIAAHSMKSTTTGVILDVEPGEAEWNLDVLESLFDFYFVQPALTAKRKADLNAKLKEAGKPLIP